MFVLGPLTLYKNIFLLSIVLQIHIPLQYYPNENVII